MVGTTGDQQILFKKFFLQLTTKRNGIVCLRLFACEPKQLQRLTVGQRELKVRQNKRL